MTLQPEKRANAADTVELDLEAAAGHDPSVATPARLVIKLDAVHVEVLADLFQLAFLARQPFVQD